MDENSYESLDPEKKEFLQLARECHDSIDYFSEIYTWVSEFGEMNSLTVNYVRELEQALEVGRTALRQSGTLSAIAGNDSAPMSRDELIKKVYNLLNIERGFWKDPDKTLITEGDDSLEYE